MPEPEPDLGTLIDDIFQDIGDVDRLFTHKFGRKLFCLPPEPHSLMNKATRGQEVDYAGFVAPVSLVIDGICHHDIEGSIERGKDIQGSINKIENILKHKNIPCNPDTIATLRTIRSLRNTTLPMHDTGSQVVDHLQKLGLRFPIENEREALFTIL